jgi:hypothetical protein
MYKFSGIVFLLLCGISAISGQSNNCLSKSQMYEDFDEFYSIMADVNPQLTLRKKVTGVDILTKISNSRQQIDTISNISFFMKLLMDNILLCNDMHNDFIFDKRALSILDTVKIQKLVALSTQLDDDYLKIFADKYAIPLPFFLDYFKGNYYNIGGVTITTNGEIDTIPQGAKILNIDGFTVDTLLILKPFETRFRWDNILKKKYQKVYAGDLILSKRDSITIEYEINGETQKVLYLNNISKLELMGGTSFSYEHKDGYVDYFEQDNILYIRLPQMWNSNYYVKQILEKGKGKKIEKVVIDIRQNGGGSDGVWIDILQSIIKKEIDIRTDIGFVPSDLMLKKLEISKDSVKLKKISLLDNQEFGILTWGEIVKPDKKSLKYNGKIYILQDNLIFSSAGSLSNVAFMSDKIVSVGETTGYLLGFGIAPIFFTLPNSYFTFQIEPVLDVSNANTLYDYYHDNVEIPVEISIEQRIKYFNNSKPSKTGGIYSKDFLYNHDPVFQKVLQLE